MTRSAPTLPRWDMTPFFPGLDLPEFAAACASFGAHLGELEALWRTRSVDRSDALPVDDTIVAAFTIVVARYADMLTTSRLLVSYVRAFTSTDSTRCRCPRPHERAATARRAARPARNAADRLDRLARRRRR